MGHSFSTGSTNAAYVFLYIALEELRKLMQEAETKKYPKTALWDNATAVLLDAEKCAQVAQSLVSGHIRTR